MRPWKIRYLLLGLLISSASLGMLGMWTTVTFEAGTCRTSYVRYHFDPVLKDYLSCREGKRPCGSALRTFDEPNAHARLIQCLCASLDRNEPAARQFLKETYCARCR